MRRFNKIQDIYPDVEIIRYQHGKDSIQVDITYKSATDSIIIQRLSRELSDEFIRLISNEVDTILNKHHDKFGVMFIDIVSNGYRTYSFKDIIM